MFWRWKLRGPNSVDTTIEIQPVTGGPSKTLVSEASLPTSSTLACGELGGCLCWVTDWNFVFTVADGSESASRVPKTSLWKVHVNADHGSPSQKPRRFAQWADFLPSSMTTTTDGKTLAFIKAKYNQNAYVGDLDRGFDTLSALRRFTLDNHDSYPQAWTQDSRGLLFVSNRNGTLELFKQGLNNIVPERIVSSAAGEVGGGNGLSPDGSWILYWQIVRSESKSPPSSARLIRQPAVGGPPETVIELPYSVGLDTDFFCPQKPGKLCVLNAWEGNTLAFYALDPARGKGDVLGKIGVQRNFALGWAVSPDGAQLAVVDHGHKCRIEILNLFSRTWHEIAVDPGWGDYQSVAWTADGKGFFLTTWLPESFELVHVTLSGKVQLLLNNVHRQYMSRPLPSPDGKHLAFQAQTVDSNAWILENFSGR